MATKWYRYGLKACLNGEVDLLADAIKVMLVDETYVYAAGHKFVSDVVADESACTGYTGGCAGAGRKTLAGKARNEDAGNDRIEFDFNDVPWTALAGGTIGGAIVIKEITNDADSLVIGFLDPADLLTNGGDVTLVPHAADGALYVTA